MYAYNLYTLTCGHIWIQELLSRGADPNIADFQGFSPWILGVIKFSDHLRRIIKAMIDKGGPVVSLVVIALISSL